MKIKEFTVILLSLLLLVAATCEEARTDISNLEVQPLKTVYEDYFSIGNIINPKYFSSPAHLELLTTHFNTVTCENDMKPDHLAPREKGGAYRWQTADAMVQKMAEHEIKVHGHTLVWHSQTHAWMTEGTPDEVRQNMINHINTVLEHFKGKVNSWDVVNEAITDSASGSVNWKRSLRTESGWHRALGADYIELAFRTARAADPDVLLYYNDYNLNTQSKALAVRNMIKDINDRYKAEGNERNLIDGVGLQGHYNFEVSVSNVRFAIEKFIEIGILIDISELDIEDKQTYGSWGPNKNGGMNSSDMKTQARVYGNLFALFRQYKDHITRVTMWGMDDESNWKSIGNPCLFDGSLNPKPAFFAVSIF